MQKIEAVERLKALLVSLNEFRKDSRISYELKKWQKETRTAIEQIFESHGNHVKEFNEICFSCFPMDGGNMPKFKALEHYQNGLDKTAALLESFIQEITSFWKATTSHQDFIKDFLIEKICDNFHLAAKQLQEGPTDYIGIPMETHFDVQNLFTALLRPFFNNIGFESRLTFPYTEQNLDISLKEEKKVIVVKTTINQGRVRDFSGEISEDIQTYRKDLDCKDLICFIYDPESKIKDPQALEATFSGIKFGIHVKVLVRPS